MAITMKSDPEKGWQIMALFEVDQSLINTAKKHGIQCVQTTPGNFVIKSALQVFGTVPVKGTALTLAQQKQLGPQSKNAFKANFETALKKGIDASPLKVPTPVAAYSDPEPAEVPGYEDPPEAYKPSPPKPVPTTWPSGSPAAKGPKLADAQNVYEAVGGTSPGSTYYVFAMFPGLNLAARLKGTKLSVRAEGDLLNDYAPHLVHDFKMDKGAGYISAHYAINEGKSLIIKTLGAMLGTLGFDKVLKVADLKKFVDDLSA